MHALFGSVRLSRAEILTGPDPRGGVPAVVLTGSGALTGLPNRRGMGVAGGRGCPLSF